MKSPVKFTKKPLAKVFLSFLLLLTFTIGIFPSTSVFADNEFTKEACSGAKDAAQKAALGCDNSTQIPQAANYLINAVISLVGIIAVAMIVVAGQRIATSNGDPAKLQQAKNMLMYSIIALIIAVLAFAIVNYILGAIFSSGS